MEVEWTQRNAGRNGLLEMLAQGIDHLCPTLLIPAPAVGHVVGDVVTVERESALISSG